MRIRAILTAACLAAAFAVAGCEPADGGGAANASAAARAADDDVEVTGCAVDPELHWPAATVRITNRTAVTSNYVVQIAFLDGAGRQVTTGAAAAGALPPGQQAEEQAQGVADPHGPVSCKVADVARYATP
ncbi:FxLYD domain-containing protein [Streptomyces sp. TLI_171]|uniref:FxLYD domain-containing protein n=1 Tax=Streptomyces sp. TLI_171 TaxID=1938859 RepID=UPI000C1A5690|nr:FxLYD domain-containing protein [Streptomyces sp. TLI_171]RKE18122.1 hypothetical protein BX266_1402 [Streptomyces sp. TLI_171]